MDTLDTKRGGFAAAWAVPFTIVASLALVIMQSCTWPYLRRMLTTASRSAYPSAGRTARST